MLEWNRPFPIPGLSRYARAIIGASRTGRVPAVALQKAYAEASRQAHRAGAVRRHQRLAWAFDRAGTSSS